MSRIILICLFALAFEPLKAQDRFVAANERTVIATTEQSNSDDPVHMMYVSNNSTVPIVVFGITLTSCENVKQSCGSRRTNIKIGAGHRANLGRVEARDRERAFSYRWSFSYHPDSSDAKAMALLREHGIELDPAAAARRAALLAAAAAVSPPATSPAEASSVEQAQARPAAAGDPAEVWRTTAPPPRPPSRTLRFKVGWGSILGSTMVPDKPVLATGSCVDPALTAKLEKSPAIEKTPWRPPRLDPWFAQTRMPTEMRDSLRERSPQQTMIEVLVRFAADTAGVIIPESVSVLESPSGPLSAKVCTSVMSADVQPAKNKEGRPVQTWVQTPVRVVPY
ncbi:MAG: hypothetical protein ACJ79A_12945 [Gemmatimonadaceae bacterium]